MEMEIEMMMKMMMMEKMKKERRTKRRVEREIERRGERKKQTQTWTPDTYALVQTTLKITIGCLCRCPSRRFQGACRFSTRKKNLPDGQTLWSVFQDGSNETRKKNARTWRHLHFERTQSFRCTA